MSSPRTLVLSVDRDDDIGFKASIESPVVGRDACLMAANTLALRDPEDSDVNAIFQAIKTYDELTERGEPAAVAILAGNHTRMLEGDRRIARDLERVIRATGVDRCILISDGAEDEFVLPIIQAKIPVESIRRVIVSQMPNLESSYYTFKKLLDDPKVARVVLVPLGLAMLLFAAAYLMGYPEGATIIVIGVIGLYLLFRGFGVDEVVSQSVGTVQSALVRGRFSFVTYISALLLAVIGVIMGMTSLLQYYSAEFSGGVFLYLVSFIDGAVWWLTAAGLIIAAGRVIDTYMSEPRNLPRVIVLPFFVGAIGLIAWGASVYTLSISSLSYYPVSASEGSQIIILAIVGGLFCAFFGVYLQSIIAKWVAASRPAAAEGDTRADAKG